MKKLKICLCPETIKILFKYLSKTQEGKGIGRMILARRNMFKKKKPRTAKQIRATKKLIAFNKRRRARR